MFFNKPFYVVFFVTFILFLYFSSLESCEQIDTTLGHSFWFILKTTHTCSKAIAKNPARTFFFVNNNCIFYKRSLLFFEMSTFCSSPFSSSYSLFSWGFYFVFTLFLFLIKIDYSEKIWKLVLYKRCRFPLAYSICMLRVWTKTSS